MIRLSPSNPTPYLHFLQNLQSISATIAIFTTYK